MKLDIDVFKNFLKTHNLTQKRAVDSFARLGVKIKIETVKSWTRKTNSSSPTLENIMLLSNIFGINPNLLIKNGKIKEYYDVRKIPISGTSSCKPQRIIIKVIANTPTITVSFTRLNFIVSFACGDSMSPFIDDGDEVICDPERKPQHGDIVEYKILNERAIKVYTEDLEANLIQFVPYNQTDTFKVRTIRLDEFNDLVVSVVVAANRLSFKNRKAILRVIGRT